MKTRAKRSFLYGIPPWGLALLTAFLSMLVLFVSAGVISEVFKVGDSWEFIAYILYHILITVACFFICRKFPGSIWYVPFLCNLILIISAVVEPTFWTSPMWIVICGGWILSVAGAVAGTIIGKRRFVINR